MLDLSTACLYARLLGERETDLGGNEIFIRPPQILDQLGVVRPGIVWKIKKALCGLRTSPIVWATERDNTLKSLKWTHESHEYRLFAMRWVSLLVDCGGTDSTVWCDQSKYILHCLRENGFIGLMGACP